MNNMENSGYIYVLINPSMKGLLKIGKTFRNPEERARELSATTGVPTPFHVAYQTRFNNCAWAESFIHELLEEYRTSDNREFFRMSLDFAIKNILIAKDHENLINTEEQSNIESSVGVTGDVAELSDKFLFRGVNCFFGRGDQLQDYEEARIYLEKSAQLGNAEAMNWLAQMYYLGDGVRENNKKALSYLKRAVKVGDESAWAMMAIIFFDEKHFDNAYKCWRKYFLGAESLSAVNCVSYVEYCVSTGSQIEYGKRIFPHKQEMLNQCDSTLRHLAGSGNAYKKWQRIRKTIKRLDDPENPKESFMVRLKKILSG